MIPVNELVDFDELTVIQGQDNIPEVGMSSEAVRLRLKNLAFTGKACRAFYTSNKSETADLCTNAIDFKYGNDYINSSYKVCKTVENLMAQAAKGNKEVLSNMAKLDTYYKDPNLFRRGTGIEASPYSENKKSVAKLDDSEVVDLLKNILRRLFYIDENELRSVYSIKNMYEDYIGAKLKKLKDYYIKIAISDECRSTVNLIYSKYLKIVSVVVKNVMEVEVMRNKYLSACKKLIKFMDNYKSGEGMDISTSPATNMGDPLARREQPTEIIISTGNMMADQVNKDLDETLEYFRTNTGEDYSNEFLNFLNDL